MAIGNEATGPPAECGGAMPIFNGSPTGQISLEACAIGLSLTMCRRANPSSGSEETDLEGAGARERIAGRMPDAIAC